MDILEFPINHNHIQGRVDNFREWLYQLDAEQLDSILCDIEQYLLDACDNLETNEADPYHAIQAAVRISESRWWVAHL